MTPAGMFSCALFVLLLTSGCETVPRKPENFPLLHGSPAPLRAGDIVHSQTGKRVSFQELMTDLREQRIVYVGETHVSQADHDIQEQILEALYAGNKDLTLAMEMFPRRYQDVLDRWSAGFMGETQFIEAAEWQKIWGYPFPLYRGLLTFARDGHLKILAINAPPEVVRKISRNGMASLDPDERAQIAGDFDFANSEHRDMIKNEYDQHAQDHFKDFESFYEAQLAWEETMAETLAQYLAARPAGAQLLVIIGNGHISYQSGVPQRTFRRLPVGYRTIMTISADFGENPIDPALADYVWITPAAEPSRAHRGRLGIVIDPQSSAAGLTILSVLPGSAADRAGLQKGDVLYQIDDVPISDAHDAHRALAENPTTPTHEIRIERDGTQQVLIIELPNTE
jgi:uncharacterized iron-regulated protein